MSEELKKENEDLRRALRSMQARASINTLAREFADAYCAALELPDIRTIKNGDVKEWHRRALVLKKAKLAQDAYFQARKLAGAEFLLATAMATDGKNWVKVDDAIGDALARAGQENAVTDAPACEEQGK